MTVRSQFDDVQDAKLIRRAIGPVGDQEAVEPDILKKSSGAVRGSLVTESPRLLGEQVDPFDDPLLPFAGKRAQELPRLGGQHRLVGIRGHLRHGREFSAA